MKLKIFFFLFLIPAVIMAQPSISRYQGINDIVIAKYNRGDYKGLYAMTNSVFRNLNSEQELKGIFESKMKNFGEVISSELIEDFGRIKHFKWTCKKGNLRFELMLADSCIQQCKINDFIRQPNALNRSVLSDNQLKTQLDSIINRNALIYMSDPRSVGLSIGVYYHGKKYTFNYGEIEKGTGKPVSDNTMFTIGSVTKPFIGVLLARAVMEKRVKLDDDVRKYLDGNFPNLEKDGQPVTLVELANHTAGFDRFRFNAMPSNADSWTPEQSVQYFDSYTIDSLYRDLHAVKLATKPGTTYHYSLSGSILLDLVLKKVYNKSNDQIVRDYYSSAFQMTSTKLAADPDDMGRYAKGYDDSGNMLPQMPHYNISLSSIHSTTHDMINFVEANVLEKDPAIRFSHQLTWGDLNTFAVGLAWDMELYYGQYKQIWHSGYDYGSISVCTIYPEIKFGMWLWANNDSRQGNLYDMERSIRENLLYLEKRAQ